MKQKVFLVLFSLIVFLSSGFSTTESVIHVQEKPAFEYAFMSFTGPIQKMPEKIMLFIGEFFKQGLQPRGAMVTVYHNSPETVPENDLKWDIGFPVATGTALNTPLQRGTYKQKTVVEYLHKGPYEQLPEIYAKLGGYIKEKGLTVLLPTFEFYLNSPQQVKPDELLTRIEIPVKNH